MEKCNAHKHSKNKMTHEKMKFHSEDLIIFRYFLYSQQTFLQLLPATYSAAPNLCLHVTTAHNMCSLIKFASINASESRTHALAAHPQRREHHSVL
jgi:hypothetical protein